jgi:hypothetical protein
MKALRKLAKIACTMVLTGAFLAACGGSDEQAANKPATEKTPVKPQDVAKEALKTTTEYANAKWEEYQKEVETKLDKYQDEINKMTVQSRAMAGDAKAVIDQRLRAMIDKKEVAQKKLAELQSASGRASEDLKAGMDAAMVDLKSAFEEASSHFESSEKEAEGSQYRESSPG